MVATGPGPTSDLPHDLSGQCLLWSWSGQCQQADTVHHGPAAISRTCHIHPWSRSCYLRMKLETQLLSQHSAGSDVMAPSANIVNIRLQTDVT